MSDSEVELDIREELEVTRDNTVNASVSANLESVTNADLLSLMKTYMNSKFAGIESNFQETTSSLAKKVNKVENNFNFKGHQIQFEFNSDLLDNIEWALRYIDKKRLSKAESILEESLSLIKKRNKLIHIADKSEGGWKTVQEYLLDNLASDSEDEKKIRAADNRAVKKLKASKTDKKSGNVCKRPAEAAGPASQVPTNAVNVPANNQPLRGSGQHFVAQRNRAEPTDQCHACGFYGNWAGSCRKETRNINQNERGTSN